MITMCTFILLTLTAHIPMGQKRNEQTIETELTENDQE